MRPAGARSASASSSTARMAAPGCRTPRSGRRRRQLHRWRPPSMTARPSLSVVASMRSRRVGHGRTVAAERLDAHLAPATGSPSGPSTRTSAFPGGWSTTRTGSSAPGIGPGNFDEREPEARLHDPEHRGDEAIPPARPAGRSSRNRPSASDRPRAGSAGRTPACRRAPARPRPPARRPARRPSPRAAWSGPGRSRPEQRREENHASLLASCPTVAMSTDFFSFDASEDQYSNDRSGQRRGQERPRERPRFRPRF